jgi:hypothetical protein
MVSASMKNSESAFMVSAFWHTSSTNNISAFPWQWRGMHFTVFTDDFGWASLPSFPVSHYYFLIFLERFTGHFGRLKKLVWHTHVCIFEE